jgi:hypothetical protein
MADKGRVSGGAPSTAGAARPVLRFLRPRRLFSARHRPRFLHSEDFRSFEKAADQTALLVV